MPTPIPSTHVFRATIREPVPNHGDKVVKRNRQPLSCEPCRVRKLKCNRSQPCDSCVRRAKDCFYAPKADRSKGFSDGPPAKAQDRLQHLEDLVLTLMKDGADRAHGPEHHSLTESVNGTNATFRHSNAAAGGLSTPNTQPSMAEAQTPDQPGGLQGHLDVSGDNTSYVGATHWAAILEDIKEVREYLTPNDSPPDNIPYEDNPRPQDPDFVLGANRDISLQDLLLSLPPRPIVESLLSAYWNSKYMLLPIIHPAKFGREYENFWRDPMTVQPLWLSLLFAMLCLSTHTPGGQDHKSLQDLGGPKAAAVLFRQRTAQCLVLGKYASATAYTVEALLLHLQCQFLASADADTNVWVIMGILVRSAMRMGYHRDPKAYPMISPFEGEMRRRVWCIISQLEVLAAFQLGLPTMIQLAQTDTQPPGNFLDSDFSEDTVALLASRPLTDQTPMTYYLTKNNFMSVFRMIVDRTLSIAPVPHTDVMDLDAQLRKAHDRIPEQLRMRPLQRSFMDPAYIIMNRLNIELLYLKSMCVLHRKYLSQERANPTFAASRRACVEAAMAILGYQAALHRETQPGGQLHQDRWMLSSLTTHDFVLAAMIVCLSVSETDGNTHASRTYHSTWAQRQEQIGQQKEQLRALKTSHHIWSNMQERSQDARRAAEVLAAMLDKTRVSEVRATYGAFPNGLFAQQHSEPSEEVPSYSVRMTTPSDIAPTPTWSRNHGRVESGLSLSDSMGNMLNAPESLDWTAWDQFILDESIGPDPNLLLPDFEISNS